MGAFRHTYDRTKKTHLLPTSPLQKHTARETLRRKHKAAGRTPAHRKAKLARRASPKERPTNLQRSPEAGSGQGRPTVHHPGSHTTAQSGDSRHDGKSPFMYNMSAIVP